MKKKSKQKVELGPLHLRYRPSSFDDVIGQAGAVKGLKSLLKGSALPHSYLFTGPSGVGKTTLARIIGTELGVASRNVLEVDAATNSGVDDMRSLKAMVETPGFGSDSRRMVIIDECHSLSKNAWQSWLKVIEEPPPHLFFVFCTTETHKVPKTIKTRCHAFDLKPVPVKEIETLLNEVCFAEQIKPASGVLRLLASKSEGSVRQALVHLSMVSGAKDKRQALSIISQADEEGNEVIEICRLLAKNASFPKMKEAVKALETDNMEGVRIAILNYFSSALMNSKSADKNQYFLAVLDEFSEPFRDYERKAPLLLALGRLLL